MFIFGAWQIYNVYRVWKNLSEHKNGSRMALIACGMMFIYSILMINYYLFLEYYLPNHISIYSAKRFNNWLFWNYWFYIVATCVLLTIITLNLLKSNH